MNRILLVGNNGSTINARQGGGACIARTKRFQESLIREGFHVEICSPGNSLSEVTLINESLHKTEYSCIVAISPHPAELAVLTGTELPMWVDMNGMHPAEVQLSGGSPSGHRLEMLRILALQNTLLSRGDFFSAPSERQTHAIMGELYLLGRLDANSAHRVPVKAIPHCAMEVEISQGPVQNEGDFSIISTGSFNSWFDAETLFDGLVFAMRRNNRISFTATGGAVPFAMEQYDTFLRRLSQSDLKNRFRIAGWVSREELESIQMQASAAVYTDIPCGETLLGARTRALDWISKGIPVVCTKGAEISETIADRGLGISVAQGDSEALGRAFLKLAAEPDTIVKIRHSQNLWRNGPGNMAVVFKPLTDWCHNPSVLPRTQLAPPTVPRVSSTGYRKRVLKEIARAEGTASAVKFLFMSLAMKVKNWKGGSD